MEIRKKQESFYRMVPVNEDVTYYVAADGKEFKNKEDADKHEKFLNVPCVEFFPSLADSYRFVYVESFEDVRIRLGDRFTSRNHEHVEKLVYPCWITLRGEFSGYTEHDYEFYSFENFKSEMEAAIEEYKNIQNKIES